MIKIKQAQITLIALLLPSLLFAADGHGGIPMGFIKLQIINFAVFIVLIGLLSYFKIGPIFKKNRESFVAESEAAKRKLEEAKKERDSFKNKILALEKNYDNEIEKAKTQAAAKHKENILSLKDSISHMGRDLEVQIESLKRSRAMELRNLMMEESVEKLKEDLDHQIDEKVLAQIQEKFVNSVEARI